MTSIIPHKICSKCGNSLPATPEFFHVRKASKDGLSYICKPCNAAHVREWRQQHKDRYDAYNDRTYEQRNEKRRAWRKANPDRVRQHKRDSQKRNRAGANRRFKRFAARNPERIRKNYLATYYRRIEREGRNFIRIANHKRRAHILNNGGSHTADELRQLYEDQHGRCAYCGISLHGEYHEDHMRPLSRGGSNDIENIALTCEACNLSKHTKTFEEWKAMRGW